MKLSVIICTHNPHSGRLQRVLNALASQTLPRAQWELIIVDNCSLPSVKERLAFPAGLPEPRIIDQPELGLTPARLAGIAAAFSSVLVFVDDDNVLSPDYLEEALKLMESEPRVGAAGGIIEPEYETPPKAWTGPYLNLLGIRDFGNRPMRALVYNQVGPWEPIGAGMVIRKEVADYYARIARDPLRRSLDRRGSSLGSCGDTDMARCAPELGYYLAYQPQLKMTHLIPAFRLKYSYFLRLCRSLKRTGILLDRIRTGRPAPLRSPLRKWLRLPFEAIRQFTPSPFLWLLRIAEITGELEGRLTVLGG